MNAYYRRPGNAAKIRASALASRERRIEEVRAYDRERGFRVYDPAKVKSRRILNHEIEAGRMAAQDCWCGEKGEAHHPDHSKPLDVVWLCRRHHAEIHRKVV